MRAHSHFTWATVLVGVLFFGAGPAVAAPLICDVTTPTECQITTLKSLGAGGAFQVDRTLHIGATGELRTNPASTLTLDVAGDLIVDVGGKITGNAAATGNSSGATIAITATGSVILDGNGSGGAVISADQPPPASCSGGTGGTIRIASAFASQAASIITQSGSRISVNARCSAGEIRISATQGGVDIRGLVESASSLSGVGSKQPPGGGPITISASCNLTVNDTGRVSSRGADPGADLVHLEAGGDVLVIGLVESTGAGHSIPNNPTNHCSGPGRPDKPANTTACVEIWAGKALVIDGTGTNRGEINADTPRGGVAVGWIDIFAKRSITISGTGAGPYAADASPYAVHAHQKVSNAAGGVITVKSVNGQVGLSGQAIQAEGLQKLGGAGGLVVIEAGGGSANGGQVDLGAASVRARGANSGGGTQAGGDIAIRSFSGQVLGVAPGELDASGGAGKPVPELGAVTLQGCNGVPPAVSYGGAATPAALTLAPSCGGNPSLPTYVVFPSSACDAPPPCQGASCPPPPCEGATCPCTGADCPPPPCEGANCPCTGASCPPPPCEGANCPCTGASCPPPPCEGASCPCTGASCPPPPCQGPGCAPYKNFCQKGSVQTVLDPLTGRFLGNFGPDIVVDVRTESLQAAIDSATDTNNDGYIIIAVIANDGGVPGGMGRQELEVSLAYDKPFALIGCGVTLLDPMSCNGRSVVTVKPSATSPEFPAGSGVTLYFQGLTVTGSESAPGWLVEGDGRLLEGIGSQMNTHGIKIVGNSNAIRNSFGTRNVINGLVVQGNRNTVQAVRATGNSSGDGIQVTGHHNTVNKSIGGDQGAGNGAAGINVSGVGNMIKANGAYANYGNGITVGGGTAGAPNIVRNNVAGGPQRGNARAGIAIGGPGAGASGAVDISGNTAQSNALSGISVTGTGHRLKDNDSGGAGSTVNVACQYRVVPKNFNAIGNTKNLAPIAGADGSAFPNGCF